MQKAKGDTFDLRAEEDAARRLNVGKVAAGNSSLTGLNSRAKRTDLIGKTALKERVEAIAKDHGVTFDTEASLYLLSAIEHRFRALLTASITAQTHRTNSSHLHPPPLQSKRASTSKAGAAAADEADGRPLWSHRITSDTSAVLDALSRKNKQNESNFRRDRMDRLQLETNARKARERATELGLDGGADDDGSPSTPAPKSSAMTPLGTPASVTFGGVKETPVKKGKKGARDVSADVQHKMANATAMRNAGIGKKYSWMMGSAPAISSPLAGGKKRKAAAESGKPSALASSSTTAAQDEPGTPDAPTPSANTNDENPRPSKRSRPTVTQPTRRLVTVSRDEKGEKKVGDERVLTMVDLVFALEHGGLGGAGDAGGQAEDVIRKIWGRPGGPWGADERK